MVFDSGMDDISDPESLTKMIQSISSQKTWPFFAVWQETSSDVPLSLNVSYFTYSSSSSPDVRSDSLTDLGVWTSKTLTDTPFFLTSSSPILFL
jgi:hypothetical protein